MYRDNSEKSMILQHRLSKTSKTNPKCSCFPSVYFLFFSNTYHEAAISSNTSDTDFPGILNKTETLLLSGSRIKNHMIVHVKKLCATLSLASFFLGLLLCYVIFCCHRISQIVRDT